MQANERNLSSTITTIYTPTANRTWLDENDSTIDTPPGLKTELYPHQKTAVKALLDAEKVRYRKHRDSYMEAIYESSAVVLSEPFGSGKTFIILAFLLYCKVPKAFPIHINTISLIEQIDKEHNKRSHGFFNKIQNTEIIKKYTCLNTPSIIIVGPSVLTQWEKTIEEYTNLSAYVIGNVFHLKKFYELYKKKQHTKYDIILVKNGNVTGSFLLDSELMNTSERSIISVISKMSLDNDACWSIAVYDDFDTIRIPSDAQCIPALFTIYVSATRKSSDNSHTRHITYESIEKMLSSVMCPMQKYISKDDELFTVFNIRNTNEYTELSTKITIIEFYKYVYVNPDDNYIRLIGVIGENDSESIAEMLNSDAISTAADSLGIKTKSASDIFEKMLDNKYKDYMEDVAVIKNNLLATEYSETLDLHPDSTHSNNELHKIYKRIIKLKHPNTYIEYKSNQLFKMLDSMMMEYTERKRIHGLAIERVKDNIKEGECMVCTLPLEEVEVFILKCCGVILCSECGIKDTHLSLKYMPNTTQKCMMGKCPKCKKMVNLKTDFIFINKEFNFEKIIEDKVDDTEEISPIIDNTVDNNTPQTGEIYSIKNPKLKALINIIFGKTPEKKEKFSPKIDNLLSGKISIPQPDNITKKILVFSNYEETLENIKSCLDDFKVKWSKLYGSFSQMYDIVEKFKTEGTVLLINSSHNCAGLNIQFATDMVFFHKIIDKNIESQVAGRGQRIGRTSNLNIHYLLYVNENMTTNINAEV
jgi:hypothetical protein